MTGVTSGQTALTTATDSDDTEIYLTTGLVAALQALANLFESATGHVHSGSGQGAPIASGGIANLAVTGAKLSLGQLTNQLASPVALNNTATTFDGPSVAQGSTGTWFASGTVTCVDTAGAATFRATLWDGTTKIADTVADSRAANANVSISLSGYLANPAGNLRISVQDVTSTSGSIVANPTGTGVRGSTISVFRIG